MTELTTQFIGRRTCSINAFAAAIASSDDGGNVRMSAHLFHSQQPLKCDAQSRFVGSWSFHSVHAIWVNKCWNAAVPRGPLDRPWLCLLLACTSCRGTPASKGDFGCFTHVDILHVVRRGQMHNPTFCFVFCRVLCRMMTREYSGSAACTCQGVAACDCDCQCRTRCNSLGLTPQYNS